MKHVINLLLVLFIISAAYAIGYAAFTGPDGNSWGIAFIPWILAFAVLVEKLNDEYRN